MSASLEMGVVVCRKPQKVTVPIERKAQLKGSKYHVVTECSVGNTDKGNTTEPSPKTDDSRGISGSNKQPNTLTYRYGGVQVNNPWEAIN